MLEQLPRNTVFIADKVYDKKAFRDALVEREIATCIPSPGHVKSSFRTMNASITNVLSWSASSQG